MAPRKTPEKVENETLEIAAEAAVVAKQEASKAASESPVTAKKAGKEKEVRSEATHQMGIFTDYIYNARELDVELVVTNLGYGDVYVSDRAPATVGDAEQRLIMGETRIFPSTTKFYAASASQPVLQIIELG